MPVIYERAEPILKTPTESKEATGGRTNADRGISLDRVSYRYSPHLPLVLDR